MQSHITLFPRILIFTLLLTTLTTTAFSQLEFGIGGGATTFLPVLITGEVYKPSIGPELQIRVREGKFFEGMLSIGYQKFTPKQEVFLVEDFGQTFFVTYSDMVMVPAFMEGRFYVPNLKPATPYAGLILGYHFAQWQVVTESVNSIESDNWFLSGQPTMGFVGGANLMLTDKIVLSAEGRYLIMNSSVTEEIWMYGGVHVGVGFYVIKTDF